MSVQLYRRGARGVVHVTTGDPARGYVRALCGRSLPTGGHALTMRGAPAARYWQNDECNRCDECSTRVRT